MAMRFMFEDYIEPTRKQEIEVILSLFQSHGGELRLVGGCVRDMLLNRKVSDFDFATTLLPEQVENICAQAAIKTIDIGKGHGTIALILSRNIYEITTLRKDVSTDGRRAVVAFTRDWREDAYRRDFTINAMSYCLSTKRLHDYSTGLEDLKLGVVRFIGDAEKRVQEDYLRIVRYFRFLCLFPQKNIVEESIKACAKFAHELPSLSGERRWSELKKILENCDLEILELMDKHKVMFNLIGSLETNWRQHFRRLHSTDSLMRLFILIAKDTDIKRLGKDLKLSNKELQTLLDYRKLLPVIECDKIFELVYFYGKEMTIKFLQLKAALSDLNVEEYILIAQNINIPKFPITGKDIMEFYNLKPSKVVKLLLLEAQQIWIDSQGDIGNEEIMSRMRHVPSTKS